LKKSKRQELSFSGLATEEEPSGNTNSCWLSFITSCELQEYLKTRYKDSTTRQKNTEGNISHFFWTIYLKKFQVKQKLIIPWFH